MPRMGISHCSAMFDVGAVLGTKGGVLGKQLKSGGILMVNVERASGLGTFNLKLRGLDLLSDQDQVDAYFELQRKRKTSDGKPMWDVVFRSLPVEDSTDPVWSEISIDFGTLCDGKKKQKFRIAVKDYDDSDDTLIGTCTVNVNQLLGAVTTGADAASKGEINTEKAIPIMRPKPKRETGKLLVASASIGDAEPSGDAKPDEPDIVVVEESAPGSLAVEEEEDIILEPTDDIEILPDDLDGDVNFADYVRGGCQLRVIVAIDYTASNGTLNLMGHRRTKKLSALTSQRPGDPRKEDSLHHFSKSGMNMYENTISKIGLGLADFDSDQNYPVYGFGAKKNGKLSHCFPVGKEKEVVGVQGILTAYKDAFKSGIAMSKPSNITEVIKTAGDDARQGLDAAMKKGHQEYSILAIFTNGKVHSVEETIASLESVRNEPLSIIVVGVGPSNFEGMSFLEERQKVGDRVHFVDAKAHKDKDLTGETLRRIPSQLVSYFSSKGIKPNPPVETDEIIIEPFNEEEQIQADIIISENGDISIQSDVTPPPQQVSSGPTVPAAVAGVGGKGKSFVLSQAKKQFGRISKQMERNVNRMIDMKVNKLFGISNATHTMHGGKKRKGKGGKESK